MGHQEKAVVGSTLRRMIMVLTLAALMVLVMAASANPAMAKNNKGPDGTPFEAGDTTGANSGASVTIGTGGSCVNHDGPKYSGRCT